MSTLSHIFLQSSDEAYSFMSKGTGLVLLTELYSVLGWKGERFMATWKILLLTHRQLLSLADRAPFIRTVIGKERIFSPLLKVFKK